MILINLQFNGKLEESVVITLIHNSSLTQLTENFFSLQFAALFLLCYMKIRGCINVEQTHNTRAKNGQ
jgi:hypothetical protein